MNMTSGLIGKNLKVVYADGTTLNGVCGGYTQAADNEPEIASIWLYTDSGNIEVYSDEIKSIDVVN